MVDFIQGNSLVDISSFARLVVAPPAPKALGAFDHARCTAPSIAPSSTDVKRGYQVANGALVPVLLGGQLGAGVLARASCARRTTAMCGPVGIARPRGVRCGSDAKVKMGLMQHADVS